MSVADDVHLAHMSQHTRNILHGFGMDVKHHMHLQTHSSRYAAWFSETTLISEQMQNAAVTFFATFPAEDVKNIHTVETTLNIARTLRH